MEISLETVQDLAPDQASLNAAKKLLTPSKWPLRGQSTSVNTIWGQCQGSGSKPYLPVIDVANYKYKCTCPSRKFPCKHVLALMWQYSLDASEFPEGGPPEWVNDWLGRRKNTAGGHKQTEDNQPKPKKSIALVEAQQAQELSPEEQLKKEKAKEKRAAQLKASTNATITAGLIEFQQWIDDQLRTGIGTFTKEINERCRRIASRLVDAKATNLASRIDEFPAKIYALPAEQQFHAVFKELGQLILLCEAWFTDEDSPDVRRSIATAENREQTLNSKLVLRKQGVWETVGEKIATRRDGLISHATWLIKVDETIPCFALLQDYYPVSAGKREAGLTIGTQIKGELAFYPSKKPLRALLVEHQIISQENVIEWKAEASDIWSNYLEMLKWLPWAEFCPNLLGEGKIKSDDRGKYWWQSTKNTANVLPLLNTQLPPLLLGSDLHTAFTVWDGEYAEIFSVRTHQWGTISC